MAWNFPGYIVCDVPYDGQCAFTAIGHQLSFHRQGEDKLTGDRVRRDIVMAIRHNPQLRSRIGERLEAEGKNINEYLTEMVKSSTWADDLTLLAASVVYDITICILRENESTAIHIGSSSCNGSIVLGYVSCQPGEHPTHYVSLLPFDRKSNQCENSEIQTVSPKPR